MGPHRRRFLLVTNPIAGRLGRNLASRTCDVLRQQGCSVMALPAEAQQGFDWAQEAQQFDALIAAGGDGTVRALAPVLQKTKLPLGLIPQGTGNVLAEETGLPRTADGLALLLRSGPEAVIPGGRANGQAFFLMAGAGFDGEIIKRLDVPLKQRVGKLAYVSPTLSALRIPDPAVVCTIDGERHEAGWVIVANAQHYGGAFRLTPGAGLEKPGFAVLLFDRGSAMRRLGQLAALGLGRLAKRPDVRIVTGNHITLTSVSPVAVQVDGDPFGTTPLELRWGDASLSMILPEAFAARLAGHPGTVPRAV